MRQIPLRSATRKCALLLDFIGFLLDDQLTTATKISLGLFIGFLRLAGRKDGKRYLRNAFAKRRNLNAQIVGVNCINGPKLARCNYCTRAVGIPALCLSQCRLSEISRGPLCLSHRAGFLGAVGTRDDCGRSSLDWRMLWNAPDAHSGDRCCDCKVYAATRQQSSSLNLRETFEAMSVRR